MKYEEQAKQFLKKRSVQKDNLVISKAEAIAALSDFAEQILNAHIEESIVTDAYNLYYASKRNKWMPTVAFEDFSKIDETEYNYYIDTATFLRGCKTLFKTDKPND